jgi:hypothetical protein
MIYIYIVLWTYFRCDNQSDMLSQHDLLGCGSTNFCVFIIFHGVGAKNHAKNSKLSKVSTI